MTQVQILFREEYGNTSSTFSHLNKKKKQKKYFVSSQIERLIELATTATLYKSC